MRGCVHYVHGKDSGPVGYKSAALSDVARQCGWAFAALDYRFSVSPQERAAFLLEQIRNDGQPLVLIGSSMGGWVASEAARHINLMGLFLLCPAFDIPNTPFDRPVLKMPGERIAIVHGWRDDIVPFDSSLRAARDWYAALHMLDDDHGLHKSTPLIGALLQHFLQNLTPRSGT